MKYYPVNLDIRGKNCLVVGGGEVGTRKVKTLLACEATVTVVSPCATEYLNQLAHQGMIRLKNRSYRSSDLQDIFLVIGATDDEELNFRISQDAKKRNMLCNIADRPEASNVILPAVVQQGDMVIAISTSGQSPAYAKTLRKEMEQHYGQEHAVFLNLMGSIRKKLLSYAHKPEVHKPIFKKLIESDILDLIRKQDYESINLILHEILGDGYRFDELISDGLQKNNTG
jgi:precorrin-2 dehydrogenase/sirohydrochlorin ferrochelatase